MCGENIEANGAIRSVYMGIKEPGAPAKNDGAKARMAAGGLFVKFAAPQMEDFIEKVTKGAREEA